MNFTHQTLSEAREKSSINIVVDDINIPERPPMSRIIRVINGEKIKCVVIPCQDFYQIKKTLRTRRAKIVNLTSQVNYYKRSLVIRINDKVKEASLLIERLTK